MKNKLQKGMAILLVMLLTSVAMLSPVKAYEVGEYAKLDNYGYQSCMNWEEGYIEVEQMMYFDGNKNFPSYYYSHPGIPCYQNRKTIRQGEVTDDNIRKIILAGYPYHTYQELGCSSEYPAYLATQLCILEYTQGENLEAYQACNTQGHQVENAIQRIKENLANQYSIGQVPVFEIVTDMEWEDYPYDPNYIFKTMHIQCREYYPGVFTIQSEDANVEILNEANYPNSSFYPNQTWKIRLPKTVQETGKELVLEICTSHATDNMWLASSTENGELFIITQDREEKICQNYTETIKKLEDAIPENPEDSENKGEAGEEKEPIENQKPKDKKEETQKPEEKEENPTTDKDTKEEEPNSKENNNTNQQEANLVFQPTIEIKQENQINGIVQLPSNPMILGKEQNENLFQNREDMKEKEEQTTPVSIQTQNKTNTRKTVITASQIGTKKLPRTGY